MSLVRVLRHTLYLMAGFEHPLGEGALRRRAELERLFVLALSGDLAGLPMLPSSHILALLPYVTPQIMTWRRLATVQGELPSSPGGMLC